MKEPVDAVTYLDTRVEVELCKGLLDDVGHGIVAIGGELRVREVVLEA